MQFKLLGKLNFENVDKFYNLHRGSIFHYIVLSCIFNFDDTQYGTVIDQLNFLLKLLFRVLKFVAIF